MWHVHWHETNLSGHGGRILTDEWFILIICPDLFKFQWTISHSCNHHLNGLLKDKRDLELQLQCIWEKPSIFILFSPRLSYSVQLLLPTPSVPEVLKFHRIGTVYIIINFWFKVSVCNLMMPHLLTMGIYAVV